MTKEELILTKEEIDNFYADQETKLNLMLEIEKRVEQGDVSIPIPQEFVTDGES